MPSKPLSYRRGADVQHVRDLILFVTADGRSPQWILVEVSYFFKFRERNGIADV